MIVQFGLSLVIPLFICILICVLLTDKLNLGSWVYIPGFILGLGGSAMTAYKFYLAEMKKTNSEKKPKASFNRHF